MLEWLRDRRKISSDWNTKLKAAKLKQAGIIEQTLIQVQDSDLKNYLIKEKQGISFLFIK